MAVGLRFYVGAVMAMGGLALIAAFPSALADAPLAAAFLAAMLAASLFKLRLPLGRGTATMSAAYMIDFMVIVLLDAGVATAIASAGVLVQCLMRVRQRQPWYRTAFSVAAIALSVQAAGRMWTVLGGTSDAGPLTTLVAIGAAAVAYFTVNSGLIAGAVALSSRESLPQVWRRSFLHTAPGYLVAASCVAVIQLVATQEPFLLIAFIAVPMAASHFVYAFWHRRLAGPPPVVITT